MKFDYPQEISEYIDDCTAETLVNMFNQIITENPELSLKDIHLDAEIKYSFGDEYPKITITYRRSPTPKEIEDRIIDNEKNLLRQKEYDLKIFEALKKKLGK